MNNNPLGVLDVLDKLKLEIENKKIKNQEQVAELQKEKSGTAKQLALSTVYGFNCALDYILEEIKKLKS